MVVTGVSLLVVAAAFQPFDGLQGVATGVLRGVGDTRTPMFTNLAAHWLLGLPLGYSLCFLWGWGVIGLWVGLATGLILLGVVLLAVCVRRAGTIDFTTPPTVGPQRARRRRLRRVRHPAVRSRGR